MQMLIINVAKDSSLSVDLIFMVQWLIQTIIRFFFCEVKYSLFISNYRVTRFGILDNYNYNLKQKLIIWPRPHFMDLLNFRGQICISDTCTISNKLHVYIFAVCGVKPHFYSSLVNVLLYGFFPIYRILVLSIMSYQIPNCSFWLPLMCSFNFWSLNFPYISLDVL